MSSEYYVRILERIDRLETQFESDEVRYGCGEGHVQDEESNSKMDKIIAVYEDQIRDLSKSFLAPA